MAKIEVLDLNGKKVGTLELADEVFGAINEDLLWEAVKHYRASQRAGTHATKNRKLVSGSGKKLWRQKGTGRARVGSIRSPLWRHGGTIHGPQPRSYDYQFPKKKLLGALRSALAARKQAIAHLPPAWQAARAQFPANINGFSVIDLQRFDWAAIKNRWSSDAGKTAAANGAKTPASSSPLDSALKNLDPGVIQRHLHWSASASWKDAQGMHFDGWIE